jgi:hypothetical protein
MMQAEADIAGDVEPGHQPRLVKRHADILQLDASAVELDLSAICPLPSRSGKGKPPRL